jgi:hypothetical protein
MLKWSQYEAKIESARTPKAALMLAQLAKNQLDARDMVNRSKSQMSEGGGR